MHAAKMTISLTIFYLSRRRLCVRECNDDERTLVQYTGNKEMLLRNIQYAASVAWEVTTKE
jgi:hypothetical protein